MKHMFCIEYLYLTCAAAGQIVSVSWRTCLTLSVGACFPPSTPAYSIEYLYLTCTGAGQIVGVNCD